jgi:hypothetical protein
VNGSLTRTAPLPAGPSHAPASASRFPSRTLTVSRLAVGVARINSIAASTFIGPDPWRDVTAVTHWARLLAPSLGLNWRVLRPIPRRLKATPKRVLHARQFHRRFSGSPFSSWPSRWPTSTFRVEPQNTQMRAPVVGGGQKGPPSAG